MQKKIADNLDNCVNEQKGKMSYGCLFCITGKENCVVKSIQKTCPHVQAITMRQLKYKTCKKVKTREEVLVLPSYVFFKAPSAMQPFIELPKKNVIRVLTVDDGVWQLRGEDERFVKWLFEYDGLLGFSQAYNEGDRIKIVSGPLKDLEGSIKRVDRRGMSGQVILNFNDKAIPVWLCFELITKVQ